MTISYPISLPTTPYAAKSRVTMANSVSIAKSPFSYSQQAQAHQGQQWMFDITMPKMGRVQAEQWVAAMAKLKGRYGTFLMGDFDGQTPMGTALGTPLVMGASQVGDSLITDGWTANKNGLLLPGDYFQLGSSSTSRLYKNLDTVNSNGSGQATLTIWPNLRSSPGDNAALTLTGAKTVCRLVADFPFSADEMSVYSITFSAEEDL